MRFFALLFTLFLSFATPLFALGATIEPSSSDLTVTPGQTAVATVSVKNDAEWLKNYEITVVQVKFGETAEEMSFTALSASLKGTVSATPRLFSLDAGASKKVEVTVRLPEGTQAQSPTLAILVTEKGSSSTSGTVQASVASILFLHVPGTLTRSMAIDSFAAVPSFTFGRDTMLSGLFRNDGQETIILPNEIRIIGPFGQEVARGPFSSDLKHLPPGTVRGLSLKWPNDTGFSRLLLGNYRFELWDGDQRLAQTSVTFLPINVLVIAGLSFIFVLLGIITSVRRRT